MSHETERVSCDRVMNFNLDAELRNHLSTTHSIPALVETIINLVNEVRKLRK